MKPLTPRYCPTGDCIELYFSDETNVYGRTESPHVTVYRSQRDDSVVGVKVHGIGKLRSDETSEVVDKSRRKGNP